MDKSGALIYKQYEKSFDANIEKMFVKAIVDMLNGNAEEVYCGVAVLYFQILMEESSRAPFCVDRESLIKIASQTIRENEEQLNLSKNVEASLRRMVYGTKFDVIKSCLFRNLE